MRGFRRDRLVVSPKRITAPPAPKPERTTRAQLGPMQPKTNTGVPADHFAEAKKPITRRKMVKLIRREQARRRRLQED